MVQIEKHVSLGGADRPSEVLMTFLFRFRTFVGSKQPKVSAKSLETPLSQSFTVTCDGGRAELVSVFKLQYCCCLFAQSWNRLREQSVSSDSSVSFLGRLIKPGVLLGERNRCRKKASKLAEYTQGQRKVSALRSFPANNGTGSCVPMSEAVSIPAPDATAEQLMAGYGIARSSDGILFQLPNGISAMDKNKREKVK